VIEARFLRRRDIATHLRKSQRARSSTVFRDRTHRPMSHSEVSMLHVTVGEKMSNKPALQHLVDCQTLTATMLRRKYSGEANSHRNMLQRAPSRGNIIHPAFRKFRDFLTHVGPRRCTGATLDRIDNRDPEYAPGRVEWADKRTQNSNKGDTLLFRHSCRKGNYTASQLAKQQGVSPSTIRKHLERGWTDDEIIEGKRHRPPVTIEHSPPVSVQRARKHQHLRPAHSKMPPDTPWQRNASYAAWYREQGGEEYCLADFETLKEDGVTRAGYEWKFAKWWPQWKPHVIQKDLPEWAQELIAKIEGTTLADIRRHQDEMRDLI
jgi:hypothetical protein